MRNKYYIYTFSFDSVVWTQGDFKVTNHKRTVVSEYPQSEYGLTTIACNGELNEGTWAKNFHILFFTEVSEEVYDAWNEKGKPDEEGK